MTVDGDQDEHWLKSWWRPAMAIQYIAVCVADFIVFPAVQQIVSPALPWHPLTLQGGGLYHLSMGAICGVTSWRRSDEKIAAMGMDGSSVRERETTDVDSGARKD